MAASDTEGRGFAIGGTAVVGLAGLSVVAVAGIAPTLAWILLCVLGGLLVARAGRAWSGVAQLILGAAGISVGISRGVRFLGEDAVAWIALCSLVAGLLLLGLGAWNLFTGINRWSRIPAGLLAVIAVPLTVYTLAIPMAATTSPRAESAPQTPVGWTDVTFSTSDGVRLSGWFTPSRNGAGIVVVPGSGSNRTGALTQAQVLADAGFAVLVYDPRGHGDSGGRAMEFGWAGDADVSAAVDFLAARPTVRSGQLGALGLSMGGEQVLGAAAADPRIEAVVAEGATNRVADDFAWLSSRYGWRGMIQRVLDAPRFALVDALADQSPPISLRTAVERISPRPVLLIAAGEVPDEGYATFHIAGDSASVQTWLVPGAGHTGALSRAPEQWRRTVVGFFDRNLL